jgi:hypothetical protein
MRPMPLRILTIVALILALATTIPVAPVFAGSQGGPSSCEYKVIEENGRTIYVVTLVFPDGTKRDIRTRNEAGAAALAFKYGCGPA